MIIDCYGMLEISEGATHDQIRAAYLEQIRKWHPDLHGNSADATERTIRINKAYKILIDPLSRAVYDKKWQAHKNGTAANESAGAVEGDLGALFKLFISAMGPQNVVREDDNGQEVEDAFSYAQLLFNINENLTRLNNALYGWDEEDEKGNEDHISGLVEAICGDDELTAQISANTDIIEENTKIAKKALGISDSGSPRKKKR